MLLDEKGPAEAGKPKVDAPEKIDSGNAGEHKEDESKEVDWEAKAKASQKEVEGNLLPQLKAARKRLGLGENDPIPTDIIEEKKDDEEDKSKDDKSEDEPDEKKEEKKEEKGDEDENGDDKPKPVTLDSTPLKGKTATEQTLMDIVWDGFTGNHKDVLEDGELQESLIRELPRFTTDSEGNVVPYQKALESAYRHVAGDRIIKEAEDRGRAKGLLEASKNGAGAMPDHTSKTPPIETVKDLSPEQKKAARNMGLSDDEYIAQLKEIEES